MFQPDDFLIIDVQIDLNVITITVSSQERQGHISVGVLNNRIESSMKDAYVYRFCHAHLCTWHSFVRELQCNRHHQGLFICCTWMPPISRLSSVTGLARTPRHSLIVYLDFCVVSVLTSEKLGNRRATDARWHRNIAQYFQYLENEIPIKWPFGKYDWIMPDSWVLDFSVFTRLESFVS